ncbi:MAG: polysaccharide deacetylase family protein [Kiritimatiellia bacterium]
MRWRLDRTISLAAAMRPPQRDGHGQVLPILMYHSVSDEEHDGGHPYYQTNTRPERFVEHMKWLRDHEYQSVDLERGWQGLIDGSLIPRAICITFDDGFYDLLHCVWPVLESYGFSATMFIPTEFMAMPRQTFKGRTCLTWPEVRRLHEAGMRFGSHSMTHAELHRLPDSNLRRELVESRALLEDHVHEPVTTFAHPYAFPSEDRDYVVRLRDALEDAGYTRGVTTRVGRARTSQDPLLLPRIPVNSHDDIALFAAKVRGAYDWVGAVQRASRSLRRAA